MSQQIIYEIEDYESSHGILKSDPPVQIYNGPINIPNNASVLHRSEKLKIIAACMEGIGKTAVFDKETLKSRIQDCLELAEELLC